MARTAGNLLDLPPLDDINPASDLLLLLYTSEDGRPTQ